MKEILTWEDAELFDYINEVEFLYVPYMDDYKYRINIEFGKASSGAVNKIETPAFGYSEIATIFMNRFNEGKLSKQKHYNEYIDNVGHLLSELELDADKFWCLYLFAFDYSNSIYGQGITIKATPKEQLQAIINTIANTEDGTIKLTIKGEKQKISVESKITLQFIADAIQNHLNSADQVTVKKLSIREQDKVTKMLDNSPFIAYFSNIILDFFDTQNHIKAKRRKGANHSLKEIDLVSRLIYFSNLSKSKSWTVAESETLKAFLRQYKNYQYPNNISSVYPEFSVY